MKLKEIREMYPEGTQIVLTEMAGESQMPYGLKGTVKFVDDAGQIHMRWENGSSIALNIHKDTFEKVEAPEKISVILVEPNKYPKMIEIEDSLEAMQKIVGGDIEEYMPFEDEVAIICNDEGKMNGMLPNRAVYAEPETVEMSYQEMTKRFREAENNRKEHLTGYVVFTEDSFDKPYSEESRTYVISSNNKAFQSGMGGYSIYASCLDGSDSCVRLDGYMSDEHGGEIGWKIEKCYMKENSREMLDIIFGQFFIAYAPIESENFQSLPKNLAEKYKEKFKYPERIAKVNGEIIAVPFKPKTKEAER